MPNPTPTWGPNMETMCYHHFMPTRRDQNMSVERLRRKLMAHPGEALINGLFQVEGCTTWLVKATSGNTVKDITLYLKRHVGKYIKQLDLHVTVELNPQAGPEPDSAT